MCNVEIITLLINSGADVNGEPATDGRATALQGLSKIAMFLSNKGAEVNAAGAKYNGRTALEGAAECGRLDIVRLLTSEGCLIHGTHRKQYVRAVGFAKSQGHFALASELRKLGEWNEEDDEMLFHESLEYCGSPRDGERFENFNMACRYYATGPSVDYEHTHTIIFLHGKGSTCEEFASELFESEASEPQAQGQPQTLQDLFPTMRWVFPSAPLLQSKRFGCVESQWFDMWSVERPFEQVELQVEGLMTSISAVQAIIAEEENKMPRDKIFLAGISQGFATAICAFVLGRQPLAGLVGLCSWMPTGALEMIEPANKTFGDDRSLVELRSTPVFLGHSKDDNIVPFENGRALRNHLSHHGQVVDWHEYESGGHWINEPEGVDDIVSFLDRYMPEKGPS
ncbi:phospholipase/Carboxylesterase [Seiridium cupressi]